MSEYTPTMDEIKGWYAGAVDEYRCVTGMSVEDGEAAFDRSTAAHDQALREQIARDIELVAKAELMDKPYAFIVGLMFAASIARGEVGA